MSPAELHAASLVLAAGGATPVALDLLVVLALATLVATIFKRLKLDSIPGYLIAGALAGPKALALVRSPQSVEQISSLATILLMFTIGLHLDFGSIRRGMVHILLIGVGSTLAVVAAGWGLGLALGLSGPVALTISMGMAISSTAVLVRVIGDRREYASVHARVGLGLSIVQDIGAVVVMALLPVIAKWAGAAGTPAPQGDSGLPSWAEFVARGALGFGGVASMILIGRYLLPAVIREVTRIGSSELLLVFAGVVALGAAIGTAALGFSPEMGAFLAGFLLAATPYRYQLAGQLTPLRDLLMVVFFTAVGLGVVPAALVDHWLVVLIGVAGLLVAKAAIVAGSAWLGGVTAPSALVTGVYLGNAGEFTLVVLSAASAAGILAPETRGIAISVVTASLVVSPALMGPAHRWGALLEGVRLSPLPRSRHLADAEGQRGAEPPTGHVIIAGFGPVGRALADRFDVRKIPYVVVELNPTTVAKQTTIGRRIVYGDVTSVEVLESAGVHGADAVVLTIPDEDAVLRACQSIRRLAPAAFIAARTNYLSQAFRAAQLGADHVTIEEVVTAQAMEREVLAKLEARARRTVPPKPGLTSRP